MKNAERWASRARFLIAWFALAGTAILLNGRDSSESVPYHQSLDAFPHELNEWTGKDAPISPDILQALGPGEFLSRNYRSQSSPEAMDLFIGYYPSQRRGDSIHSPQNCLPGAGWTPLVQDRIQIFDASAFRKGNVVTANRYVLAKGMDRVFVLYWYQARGRTTPSEYWAKIYLVRDSILMHRTDGAIVRIASVLPNPSVERQEEGRAVKFAELVLSKLDDYVPR